MTLRVVVWGTGNAGRPAIRAVAAHRDLELVGAVVADPAKVGRDAGEIAGIGPLGVRRHRRRRRSHSPTTSTRSSTPRPVTPGPMPRSPTWCGASKPVATWSRPRSTPAPPAHRAPFGPRRRGACLRDRELVGVRVRHRPRLGARHPPGARERRRRRHHRGPRAGAVQLRAVRPARRRPRRHRLRRPDGPAPVDAARRLAADGVGTDGAPPRRLPRARARRRDHLRRAAPARAHHRGPGDGDLRGRHPGRVPLRGAGRGRRPRAGGRRARDPHRRRLRARLAAAGLPGGRAPGAAQRPSESHGRGPRHRARGAGRRRRRQRERGEPHRERHPGRVRRAARARSARSTSR